MTNQTSNIIVTFDGKYLSYEKDGQLVKIPAFSGQPGYQNPNENQGDTNKGLLPMSTYNVKQSEYQEMDSRIIDNVLGIFKKGEWPGTEIAWGTERVWIEPAEGTDAQGRTNLSIHGGIDAGSKGCIDLVGGADTFFDFLTLKMN